ncbi:hypothetical protein GCM10023143_09920 [Compostibacter hankyongensis]|uniref:DUF4838 domain-containing protein n=1 Tax=Compostibacter hankyongensis TaxID=1007089 RepID=A0ABP8FJ57_9BACT
MPLAADGKAKISIQLPENPSETQRFAAAELAKYLQQISGVVFSVKQADGSAGPVIKLLRSGDDDQEGYSLSVRNGDILLEGHNDRSMLYAVYDFLERLGCEWLAPDFPFYAGHAEMIPRKQTLDYTDEGKITETPVFAYRKLDVAGTRTHDVEQIRQLIDWMPKLRYNVLRFAMARDDSRDEKWAAWRTALTPELKKRGIIIEVGGHGYQRFLNARMEQHTLFKKHPGWFGKDSSCRPSPSDRLVFNTADSGAVNYFLNNVAGYIKDHPEIDIFDLWPPDVGRWADCPEMKKLGTVADRQARLANRVDSMLKKIRPGLRLEIIAYAYALLPPAPGILNKDIQVEICPINQQFEHQIYDTASAGNAEYVKAIQAWKGTFQGSIGLYSYYRKQAWRSLANVIPHYIQRDMQWYAGVPLAGISCYAEPGDWYTYELNHYILGETAWNPGLNVDTLIRRFCRSRYGSCWKVAEEAYADLEKIVPIYGSIPFSTLKPAPEIEAAQKQVEARLSELRRAKTENRDSVVAANLSRLLLMFGYLRQDLQIQHARASGAPREAVLAQVKDLLAFLQANAGKGVAILTGADDLGRFTKKYGLTHQSLLD